MSGETVALEAYRYAQSMAVTAKSRGDEEAERAWLDLLHLLDKTASSETAPAAVPAHDVRELADAFTAHYGPSDTSPFADGVRHAARDFRALADPEPVTAPLPNDRVLRAAIAAVYARHGKRRLNDVNQEEWVDAVLAAGYTLPAAAQRARDEGTVRRAVLDAIEDPGRDDENPASRERIAGWRACAQDVRDALESVEDDDEGTVRVPRQAWDQFRASMSDVLADPTKAARRFFLAIAAEGGPR